MHCIRVAKIGLIFLPFFLHAQTPDLFWSNGAADDQNISELVVESDGNIIIGATFEKNFLSLTGRGGADLALVKLSGQGELQWRRQFGSIFNDEWAGIVTDSLNHIYALGSFWLELHIDTLTLFSEKTAKALFWGKFSTDGELIWGQKVEGTGLKVASELAIDENGRLLIAGYFSDTLFLGDQQLVAQGKTDLFIARFLADGQLDWASSAGYRGDTRAIGLCTLPGGSVAITGYYNDTTRIGAEKLIANTTDRDVFVSMYDTYGQPKWARRAGGVHDDDATAIRYSGENGNLYVTGYLVGVMNLSDDLSIQSTTGNSDFYLLTYDTSGTPLAARAYGGREIQQTTGLVLHDDQVWLSGFYQGEMTIGNQTVDAGKGIGSFLAGFNTDLEMKKIYNFPSDANVLINTLVFDFDNRLLFGGAYTNNLVMGSQSIPSSGGFDLFLGQVLQATPLDPGVARSPNLYIFPNPGSDRLYLRTDIDYKHLLLVDIQGITVFESSTPLNSLSLSSFPSGIYYLLLINEEGRWGTPIVIAR